MIIDIHTQEEFEEHLKAKMVVAYFRADWCGPCRAMEPMFAELSEMEDNKDVVFLKVDIDTVTEVAARYSLKSIPTFVFFQNGQESGRCVGVIPKTALMEKMADMRA